MEEFRKINREIWDLRVAVLGEERAKEKSVEELSQRLYEYVLKVASGEKVKAEEAGFHDMAIFKQGVTL